MTPSHLFAIALVVLIYGIRIAELSAKRDTIAGRLQETATFRMFFLAGLIMFAGAIAEFLFRKSEPAWPLAAAGVLCAAASFWIRWQAIEALGRFWSLHVEIREEHQLVRSGPFRWMRHPTYFSMVLELLAGALILKAWTTFGFVCAVFVPALLLRLRIEERALIEKFGDAYRAYQRETPAILPAPFLRTR